jgi:hypothetical protein
MHAVASLGRRGQWPFINLFFWFVKEKEVLCCRLTTNVPQP